ncbi:sensor domain-containing protein [Crossiella sp. SN42]|uniref:sensor domain-containing protein n=1 Tax=Crossiella sp. SN42 TaxID=2944808 RepID=UPI00207C4A97|nr:sensor domain-containing protein [Crossiella sp. SN42]MCO1577213.1 sensor domain-containing protein [Crossiella sp. SN42]
MVATVVTWSMWPSGMNAVPGTVQASVLPAEDVSKVLGQTLQAQHGISEPPPALTADPLECAVAVGPATQAVYAGGWTSFGSVTYQDSDSQADHTVTQVIGLYPTSDHARQVFGTLTNGIANCPTAVRAGGAASTRASQWNYELHNATAEAVSWVATQDAGDGWACHRQARLKERAVLQVAVCQAGDSRQAAAAIADQLVSRVSG